MSDLRQDLINRLMGESLKILQQLSKDQAGTNGGFRQWFQRVITQAEESNNGARSIAAVAMMGVYAEELTSPSIDQDSLVAKVQSAIEKLIGG